MFHPRAFARIALLIGVSACAEQSAPVDGPGEVLALAAAKPGGPSDPTAIFTFPNTGYAVLGDGLYLNGGNSEYANGVCGVVATIFATTAASNSGDARMQTDNPSGGGRKCADFPRVLRVDYGDGTDVGTAANVRAMQNTTFSIPVGDSARRMLVINGTTRCGVIKFGDGGDSVFVRRVTSSEWRIHSQGAGDRALCTGTGVTYPMQVDFTIRSSFPLP